MTLKNIWKMINTYSLNKTMLVLIKLDNLQEKKTLVKLLFYNFVSTDIYKARDPLGKLKWILGAVLQHMKKLYI